jgi:hypothetical protein
MSPCVYVVAATLDGAWRAVRYLQWCTDQKDAESIARVDGLRVYRAVVCVAIRSVEELKVSR